jgi:hypothetical protein
MGRESVVPAIGADFSTRRSMSLICKHIGHDVQLKKSHPSRKKIKKDLKIQNKYNVFQSKVPVPLSGMYGVGGGRAFPLSIRESWLRTRR